MAVSRIKTSSVLQGFPKSRSLLAGNTAYDPAGTWLIQRVAGTGSSGTITFSSIPQTYKHLQIRVNVRTDITTIASSVLIYVNGDTGTNYIRHNIVGNGTSVSASASAAPASSVLTMLRSPGSTAIANSMGCGILDVMDYTSTSKNKVLKSITATDNNGSGSIYLYSGAWLNTAAVSSITIYNSSGNFTTTSTFALYGIVG